MAICSVSEPMWGEESDRKATTSVGCEEQRGAGVKDHTRGEKTSPLVELRKMAHHGFLVPMQSEAVLHPAKKLGVSVRRQAE